MAKVNPAKLETIVDMLTSEHSEFDDLVQVRAAVSRVLQDAPLLAADKVVEAAVGLLRGPQDDAQDTPEAKSATSAALADIAAQVELGYVTEEADGETLATIPPGESAEVRGYNISNKGEHPVNIVRSEFANAEEEVAFLRKENLELHRALRVASKPMYVLNPPVGIINGTDNDQPTPAEWSYNVNDPSRLPATYKTADGKVDHGALKRAMRCEVAPAIPGCLISRRA